MKCVKTKGKNEFGVRENKLAAKMEGCAKIRLAKNTMSENWYDAKFELSKVSNLLGEYLLTGKNVLGEYLFPRK